MEVARFEKEPTLGTEIRLDEQRYELIAVEPYTRKTDGRPSNLLIWETSCPVCDEPYRCTTGMVIGGLARRCEQHRNTGKPVKGKRGRKVKIEVVFP